MTDTFQFNPRFINQVKLFFGSEMSSTLQEDLENGDYIRVIRYLRTCRKWKTFEEAVEAIIKGNPREAKATAAHDDRLIEFEKHITMALLDWSGVTNGELVAT